MNPFRNPKDPGYSFQTFMDEQSGFMSDISQQTLLNTEGATASTAEAEVNANDQPQWQFVSMNTDFPNINMPSMDLAPNPSTPARHTPEHNTTPSYNGQSRSNAGPYGQKRVGNFGDSSPKRQNHGLGNRHHRTDANHNYPTEQENGEDEFLAQRDPLTLLDPTQLQAHPSGIQPTIIPPTIIFANQIYADGNADFDFPLGTLCIWQDTTRRYQLDPPRDQLQVHNVQSEVDPAAGIWAIDFLPVFFERKYLTRRILILFDYWGADSHVDLAPRIVGAQGLTVDRVGRTIKQTIQRARIAEGGGLLRNAKLGTPEYWKVLVVMSDGKRFDPDSRHLWRLHPPHNLLFNTRKKIDWDLMTTVDEKIGRHDPLPTPRDIPTRDADFIFHNARSPFFNQPQPMVENELFQHVQELRQYREELHPLYARRAAEEAALKQQFVQAAQAQGFSKTA